jgi:hypothetical protein
VDPGDVTLSCVVTDRELSRKEDFSYLGVGGGDSDSSLTLCGLEDRCLDLLDPVRETEASRALEVLRSDFLYTTEPAPELSRVREGEREDFSRFDSRIGDIEGSRTDCGREEWRRDLVEVGRRGRESSRDRELGRDSTRV